MSHSVSNGGLTYPARRRLEAVLLAVAFVAAHTQSPLFYSNQNQYFLHGAALAGSGHLAHDWLATTRDPTPLFSALVAGAYSIHPWLLQPAYSALLMSYFFAVRCLVATVPGFPDTRTARIAFAALFTATHAAILRWASVEVAGVDYPWYLQAGVASQYLLGPGIQPSAFGVLLVFALAAFAHGRPVLACALAAGACWFHSTYFLPAGLLVLGLVFTLSRDGRTRIGVVAGTVALGIVVPVIAFTIWRFNPFAEHSQEALHLLAKTRIPHHCLPSRWFDLVAGLQLAWIVLGLLLARRTGFGRALRAAALSGLLLTGLQLVVRSDALALAFPWRITVLLVPVATAIIIAKLLASKPLGKVAERAAVAWLLALVAGGMVVTAYGLGYRTVDEHAVYDHVRATAKPDDVYLIPTNFPPVGSGRGAVSNTFKPAPRAKEGTNQIPVDLQRFRLATGARLYVDFKSVPYAADEVKEWRRRMTIAVDYYTAPAPIAPTSVWHGRMAYAVPAYAKSVRDYEFYHEVLKREGITHVVAPRARAANFLREEGYSDSAYIVYRVK